MRTQATFASLGDGDFDELQTGFRYGIGILENEKC